MKSSRKNFSLSRRIKKNFPVYQRILICQALEIHFLDALSRYPDDPLIIRVPGANKTFALSDNPKKPGKVLVKEINH